MKTNLETRHNWLDRLDLKESVGDVRIVSYINSNLPYNWLFKVLTHSRTKASLTRFGVMCSSDQTINFISKEMMLKQLIVSNNVLDTNLYALACEMISKQKSTITNNVLRACEIDKYQLKSFKEKLS
ncbi:hypothetical protein Scep_003701 [Stephania cephalantha]|uniref:Uncharacterized protein n=1 Tax=Stephania cephalantha TaxID=152367 RepID=A0AAP0KSZ0_9MAGN